MTLEKVLLLFVVGVAKFFFKTHGWDRCGSGIRIGEAKGFAFKSSSVLYGESVLTITTE